MAVHSLPGTLTIPKTDDSDEEELPIRSDRTTATRRNKRKTRHRTALTCGPTSPSEEQEEADGTGKEGWMVVEPHGSDGVLLCMMTSNNGGGVGKEGKKQMNART